MDDDDVAAVLMEERAAAGLDREELVRRAGFEPASAARRLHDLLHDGRAVAVGARVISAAALAALEARAEAELETFHAAKPEEPGWPVRRSANAWARASSQKCAMRYSPGCCHAASSGAQTDWR